MTTIPPITPLPSPPPSTADPTDFDSRADAFLGALPTMVTEENAAIAAMNLVASQINAAVAADTALATAALASATTAAQAAVAATSYVAESASSFSLGTGSMAFTIPAGKGFTAGGGDDIVIRRKGDGAVRMYGLSTSYSGTTLTINVTSVVGSGGPFTDWVIVLKALFVDEIALRGQAIAFASVL